MTPPRHSTQRRPEMAYDKNKETMIQNTIKSMSDAELA